MDNGDVQVAQMLTSFFVALGDAFLDSYEARLAMFVHGEAGSGMSYVTHVHMEG
jgi:hypothetical protein